MAKSIEKNFVSTRNACKVCTPLGASVAYKGIKGCVPLIHGSQGCSTYIRRYLISHYKEPVDIASTNFTEESAVYGGKANLNLALTNVIKQYKPEIIGIATTCLSETIGDDMQQLLLQYKNENAEAVLPELVFTNTPSYSGTHADGFHNTVKSVIKHFAVFTEAKEIVNIFPGYLSPADLRQIKEIVSDFEIRSILTPDYSDTLDNEYNGEYERIPQGGTTIDELKLTATAKATVEFGYILNKAEKHGISAGEYLEDKYGVPRINTGIPIGIKESDAFFEALEKISGKAIPKKYSKQRGRLIDSYVDGHKYVFGKKAVVYGEEDFVVSMVSFLEEIGIETVLCASGGNSGVLESTINERVKPRNPINVHSNYDFEEISEACNELKPDLLIGNSKGYYISRRLKIPLVRVGFPIHDRLGGQRIKHIAYEGTQELFDRIANALIEYKQENSPVGYKYM
jgi:nitrogenase molybdenum-iron protein NifN